MNTDAADTARAAERKLRQSTRTWLAAIAIALIAIPAFVFLSTAGDDETEWGVRWVERHGNQLVVVRRKGYDDSGDDQGRVDLLSLRGALRRSVLVEEGALRVVARTQTVLWAIGSAGLVAFELPTLVRHRVGSAVRGHPRLGMSPPVIVGTIDNRLVLRAPDGAIFDVAMDGVIARIIEDIEMTDVFGRGREDLREPLLEGDAGIPLEALGVESPLVVGEGGLPVVHQDVTLVASRRGRAHVLHGVRGASALWSRDAADLLEIEDSRAEARVVWARATAEAFEAVVVSRRFVANEGGDGGGWSHAATLFELAPTDGSIRHAWPLALR